MSFPPIPTREDSDSGSTFMEIITPVLARVLIELPREHQRRANFHPFCPARIELEKIVGQEIALTTSEADRERLIWLSKLTAYALEMADELHQLDGKAALDFAAGYVAGEIVPHDLFGGPEIEEQALASAIEQSHLRAAQPSPFVNGFQARRDQRRAAAADGKEGA